MRFSEITEIQGRTANQKTATLAHTRHTARITFQPGYTTHVAAASQSVSESPPSIMFAELCLLPLPGAVFVGATTRPRQGNTYARFRERGNRRVWDIYCTLCYSAFRPATRAGTEKMSFDVQGF